MLAFSRRQIFTLADVDLNVVVAGTGRMIGRLIGEDVVVETDLDAGLSLVRADVGQIEQVFVNLVVNARDAMPHGGALRIETRDVRLDAPVATERELIPAGAYVRLAVSDTGEGISADVLPHIFEPFFTTKEHGKGTGLGLSTVYGIIKQWRGHVELDSQSGQGTEFRVWLPAQAGPADSVDAVERPRPAPGRETVLLAEDEPQVRRLIHTVLEQAGYTVLVAEDGQHALRVAEGAGHVDLLVSDVRMPHLGGVELARRLRLLWPEVQVLLMSGYPDIDAVNAQASGVGDALFAKPFDTSDLLDRVRNMLDLARAL
jgi:two-component system cell cycle sensor histidine kinase/response regulator CckA